MENQEAISVLESISAKTDYFLINDDARAEAIDMAISALEKQIPKKPDKVPSKDKENLWAMYCPSCKKWIGTWNSRLKRGNIYNIFHSISNGDLCSYCGQAIIDLEENKE